MAIWSSANFAYCQYPTLILLYMLLLDKGIPWNFLNRALMVIINKNLLYTDVFTLKHFYCLWATKSSLLKSDAYRNDCIWNALQSEIAVVEIGMKIYARCYLPLSNVFWYHLPDHVTRTLLFIVLTINSSDNVTILLLLENG